MNLLSKPISALLFSLALHAPIAPAVDMGIGGILPGGGLIRKNVLSIKEQRYVNLIRQNTDFSCGAASLATLLKYAYQMDVGEEDVLRGLMAFSNPEVARTQGFSMLNFKNYLASLGLRGRGYEASPDMLDKIKVPTIVLLNIKGYRHFVVLRRSTAEHMYLGDPALGNRVMPRDEFFKAWQDSGIIFAVLGNGYNRDNILLHPKPPLTARQHIDTFRPVRDAELLDFGFIHKELF